jgi:hypothetical protein
MSKNKQSKLSLAKESSNLTRDGSLTRIPIDFFANQIEQNFKGAAPQLPTSVSVSKTTSFEKKERHFQVI